MRYTIIHHDVREQFELSLGQYVVADSIHQLSVKKPTTKPNTEIAEFVGLDETTVRRAKIVLLEKGLIEENDGYFTSTDLWYEAVTFKQKEEDSAKSRKARLKAESHLISKEVTSEQSSPSFSVQEISDTEKQVRQPRENFRKKYDELCSWMENLTGVTFVDKRGQYKALKLAREADIAMARLKDRAEELWQSGKYELDGMDWFTVVYSFNKKA